MKKFLKSSTFEISEDALSIWPNFEIKKIFDRGWRFQKVDIEKKIELPILAWNYERVDLSLLNQFFWSFFFYTGTSEAEWTSTILIVKI